MTFPKTKPPHNIRVLHGWLREYAGERHQAEGRLKRTVDYTLVLTALDRVRDSAGNHMFAVKGGVAMELRLRLSARATVGHLLDVDEVEPFDLTQFGLPAT